MGTSLFRCLSVAHHSSPSICSVPFVSLCSAHALSLALSLSPAGTVSILIVLSVSISQQPHPSGCVLPTLLHEESWRSAFFLRPSLAIPPAFKINLAEAVHVASESFITVKTDRSVIHPPLCPASTERVFNSRGACETPDSRIHRGRGRLTDHMTRTFVIEGCICTHSGQ